MEREGALEQRPAVVGEGQAECLTESTRTDRELARGRRRRESAEAEHGVETFDGLCRA